MKRLSGEDRAGLYITVIFHLAVLIVLLAAQLGSAVSEREGMLVNFSPQEQKEAREEVERMKEEIARKLEERLASLPSSSAIRNIAVDANLRDDRGTDADKLYEDARRLQESLDNGKSLEDLEKEEERIALKEQKPKESAPEQKKPVYQGPSVLSWSLDGRKASRLPIPAYRCYGGGEVTVLITVNNAGVVEQAQVMQELSSQDHCLQNYAIRAARLSRFSQSSSAPLHQKGSIVYRFIAQ